MTRTWFTADIHFGHKNVIKFCDRPFKDVDEMDDAIISRWRDAVAYDDVVYVLGDVSFHRPKRTREILHALTGRIILIRGNHDKEVVKGQTADRFEAIHELYEAWFPMQDGSMPGSNRQKVVMCHYPMMVWNKSHHGSWHLHGHCHGGLRAAEQGTYRLDVGMDCHGFKPVSLEDVRKMMVDRRVQLKDHHRE